MSEHRNLRAATARDLLSYRLYCFDAKGERLPAEPIDAEDDLVAIALVRLQLLKRCELWHGDRLVFQTPERRRNI